MPATVVVISDDDCAQPARRVAVDRVHSVISNRVNGKDEQYLVRWTCNNSDTKTPPLSWHSINELKRCLEIVQDYLETREEAKEAVSQHKIVSKKRKSPDAGLDYDRRPSPFDRRGNQGSHTPVVSRSSSLSSSLVPTSDPIDVYNGVLDTTEDGFVFCRPVSNLATHDVSMITGSTSEMAENALSSKVDNALILIRAQYVRQLKRVPGQKPIHLINSFDASTPSLRFRYISEYVLMEGIYRASLDTQQGCQSCLPDMGRAIGCEYTKKCGCLEYAAVDEGRLTAEQKVEYAYALENNESTMGFPKKFPYFTKATKEQRAGCLVSFYLESRRAIYECNDSCRCGPHCRNKNVQFGRTVAVEIFKTASGRGWGLRCTEPLYRGQFIDTYRGEIITDDEASRRERTSRLSKAKASYLYSLDKFTESEGLDDEAVLVVDGEFMGGPTKFINHSCEPNCRQYTVSYNKNDPFIYDIAFFACRDIPAGEELTFDYLDKDDGEAMDPPGEGAIPCLCGAAKCRKWLWT